MISVSFSADKESGSIALKLTGHAEAAKKGEDIVCSAASILAYTVAQSLLFMYADDGLQKKPHIKMENGDAYIVAKPKPEAHAEALHIFFVAQVGYDLLARSYPHFVELKSFGKTAEV